MGSAIELNEHENSKIQECNQDGVESAFFGKLGKSSHPINIFQSKFCQKQDSSVS